MYCWTSSQLRSRAGALAAGPFSPESFGQALAVTHAFHCSTVTSYLPIANGAPIVTRCGGLSEISPELLPIVNEPAGSEIITGQAAQSLLSPATGALAADLSGALGVAAAVAGAGAGAGGGVATIA